MNQNQLLREALRMVDRAVYIDDSGKPCLNSTFDDEILQAALARPAEPAEGGEVDNVKSSAGLIRPGKVDAWVANHYTAPPASQEQAQQPTAQAQELPASVGYSRLIQAAADLALQTFMPSDIVDDYPTKTLARSSIARMMEAPREKLRLLSIEVSEGAKQMRAEHRAALAAKQELTGRPRPLDPNALSHAINVMPWRDEVLTPDRLREFGAQLWLQFCADPVARPKQGGQ